MESLSQRRRHRLLKQLSRVTKTSGFCESRQEKVEKGGKMGGRPMTAGGHSTKFRVTLKSQRFPPRATKGSVRLEGCGACLGPRSTALSPPL
jgi:hypothetical protein